MEPRETYWDDNCVVALQRYQCTAQLASLHCPRPRRQIKSSTNPGQRLRPKSLNRCRKAGAPVGAPMSACGSFASILLCLGHVRLGGNIGNAGCPVLSVEGIGLDVIQAPELELESCATNSVTMNGPQSGRCCRTSRAAFSV